MEKFSVKTVKELLSGDIVLHPIFRSDGLLMVSRYKILEGSILIHIKKQVEAELKILTVSSLEKLDKIKNFWRKNQQEYLDIMKEISNHHRRYLKIQIEDNRFIDPTLVTNVKVDENHENITANEMMFISPLWKHMDNLFDSNSILKRKSGIIKKLQNAINNDESINHLYNRLLNYHDVLMIHSANTACLSFMTGLTLELSDDEMIDLTLAAMFADIGFTKFPKDEFIKYLKNYSANQSRELSINHIKYSVEELSLSPSCRKKSIIYGVLDHHELYDGSGFPNGKKGDDIHLYSRIIAIAQHYDLLTGGYTDKGVYAALDAYHMMFSQIGTIFDPNIFKLFLHRSTIFKIGEEIILPDYKKGVIIGFTDYINYPLAPKVKLTDGTVIDLFKRVKKEIE